MTGEKNSHEAAKSFGREIEECGVEAKGSFYSSDSMGILVDDSDADLVGEWKKSTFVKGYQGLGYIHDAAEGKGRKKSRFPCQYQAVRYLRNTNFLHERTQSFEKHPR